MKAFYAVAQEGSFTKAAEKLHISHSALSRSVALLEESEGVQLFLRSKSGVELTPIGAEIFGMCERIFNTCQDIQSLCRGNREACQGPLAFATMDHVLNYLLAAPLHGFLQLHPRVLPTVITTGYWDVVEQVRSAKVEFGLTFTKVPDNHIEYRSIAQKPMALVCHPDIWASSRSSSTAKTLAKAVLQKGYIASRGVSRQEGPSRVLAEIFGEMPRISFEVDSQESQKALALNGGGIAFLSKFMVEKELSEGLLIEIPTQKIYSFH